MPSDKDVNPLEILTQLSQAQFLLALYGANDSHLYSTQKLLSEVPQASKSLYSLLNALCLDSAAKDIRADLQCKFKAGAIAKTPSGQIWDLHFHRDPSTCATLLTAEDITATYDNYLCKKILLEMAEKTPDYVGIARDDHTPLWINDATLAAFKAKHVQELRDKQIEDVQPEGIDSLIVEKALAQVREQGFLVTETVLTTPSGENLGEFSQVITGHKDPLEGTWNYGTVLRDLGPRKIVELELKSTHNKLQFLLDQTITELEQTTEQVYYGRDVWRSLVERHPDLILFTMDNGEILFSNQAFLEESGFHLVGQSVFSLLEASYRPALEEAFKRLMKGQSEHVSVDAEIHTPGGQKHICVVFINRLERRDGSHAATWLFSDATEAVKNRNHLLANEKMAATGRMAARIAHEINNPLAAIKGSLSLIRLDRNQDDPSMEYIDIMEKELGRVSNIIRQMYGLYRPEQEPARGIQLAGIVNDCCMLLQSSASMRRVDLVQDVTSDIRGYCSESNLRQVLFNVLNNAIDAAPENSSVRIESNISGSNVHIHVIDQGKGIDPEILDQIFEPFFTTKESFHGSGLGLGLAVSASLMHGMGGDLSMGKTTEGHTRATITLKRPPKDKQPVTKNPENDVS